MKRFVFWSLPFLVLASPLLAQESAVPTVPPAPTPSPPPVVMMWPVVVAPQPHVYVVPQGAIQIPRPDIVIGNTVIHRPDIVIPRPTLYLPGPAMAPAAYPAPPLAAPMPEAHGGSFSVHLGSYLQPELAGATGKHLGEMNYPYFQTNLTVNGKQFIRVYVGPFATEQEAEDARVHLEKVLKIEGKVGPTPPRENPS